MPQIGSRLVDNIGAHVVRNWIRSLPNTAPPEAPIVGTPEGMLSSTRTALVFLDSLTGYGHVASTDPVEFAAFKKTRDEISSLAAAHTNALIRDLFQRLLPPSQRRKTLGAEFHPGAILSLTGDAKRGRAVFTGVSQCASCHACAGEGRNFGPDLSGLARKYNRTQLLEQILQPSKFIAPEFKTTTLTLSDETELSGFILSRDNDGIVLRDSTLAERRIPAAQVRESRESTLSAMPEGLLAPLTAQEAADLLEFLLKPAAP
jgi:putative heme-binding domain-containing protein